MVLWLDRVVLAIFLMGAASAYLDPTRWWFAAVIAAALPLLAALLLPLALLLWRGGNRLMALVHVMLVVVVASRHFSLERFLERSPSDGNLVLMTLNAPRKPDSKGLSQKLAQLVRAAQPDMIGLQEASIWAYKKEPERIRAHTKFRPLVESLGYSMHPPRVGPPDVSWTSWHQPLLARFEIEQQEQLSFQEEHSDSRQLHVLRSEFTWQGRKAAHYNVHLFTHGSTKPWRGDGWLGLEALWTQLGEVRRSLPHTRMGGRTDTGTHHRAYC